MLKKRIVTYSLLFTLICISTNSRAQTFSLGVKSIQYSYAFEKAKNEDYFFGTVMFSSVVSNYYYLTRIDTIGKVKWEKYFPANHPFPDICLSATSDNGLILFAKDYDTMKHNYSLLVKLNENGNVQWAKRFLVSKNLLTTPVSVIENENREYVLLYDVVENNIYKHKRPQISVFSSTGELISQRGTSPSVFGGNDYYSNSLYINSNGDYIIGAEVVLVDFENNSASKVLKIFKDHKKPILTDIVFGDSYDSDWPNKVIEKNNRLFIIGGYGVYSDYPYKFLSTYTSFGDRESECKVTLMEQDVFLNQQLVNAGKIPHKRELFPNIDKNGNMYGLWYNEDHVTINKWTAESKICPDYTAPLINTRSKVSTARISRIEVRENIDTISQLENYNLLPGDTSLIFTECNDIILSAQNKFSKSGNSSTMIFPNPAKDFTLINFQLLEKATVAINVLSMDGKILQSMKENLLPGKYQRRLNIANLATGFYIIQLITGNKKETIKLVKD